MIITKLQWKRSSSKMEARKRFLCIAVVLFGTLDFIVAIHPPYGSTTLRLRRYEPDLDGNVGGVIEDIFSSLFPGFGSGNNNGNGNRRDTRHPLDSLTEAEINATTAIIKNYRRGNWIFNYITLKEPEKSVLLPYFLNDSAPRSSSIPRRSFTILLDRSSNQAYEVTVNLDTRQVESWNQAPAGVIPSLTPEELLESENIVRANSTVQERCRRLGYANMSLVNADPWSMGYIGDRQEYQGKRLTQLYLYGKNFQNDNQYTHPFDFLVVVDLLERKVINIEELPTHDDFDGNNKQGNSVPRETSNYDPALRPANSFRSDLKPVKVTQSGGSSYSVTGNQITWQKYKMRIGFNGREGMVIHNVNYKDQGKVRPLFYRMSLAEMFIPYGDPRPPYHRKHVFDSGQYGLGFNTNSLNAQIDCIGEVHFFDTVLHNQKGEAQKVQRVICVNEEDAGILWKHTDYRTGKASITRSQRLAITFIATVGNYDYIFAWNFYQDGTIEFHVKLTGILSTHLLAVNATPAGHGSIVFPQINAPYHQHFFCLRLDAEIDGNQNTVATSDVVSGPGTTGTTVNPYGQGFSNEKTTLRTAGQARTNIAPERSRTWVITNPKSINAYTKQPVGWKLMPWASPPMLLRKDSPIHPMAEWMDYNTWVTPYQENQLYPGGFYLNNSGLPEWVGRDQNANVENTDVVLWHNFGLSHVPRVEDFPVMPVEHVSIMLKPYNFFKENPALDVPAPRRSRTEL